MWVLPCFRSPWFCACLCPPELSDVYFKLDTIELLSRWTVASTSRRKINWPFIRELGTEQGDVIHFI